MRRKQKRKDGRREGQGIIEYILLITALIVFFLLFFRPGGIFQSSYNKVIGQQGDDMLNMAEAIFD